MGRRDDAFGSQTSRRLRVFAGAADRVAGRTRALWERRTEGRAFGPGI